ncbi:MAG: hypothetical protein SGI97_10945 [candidate division Zixibacteria bacterium]|nr:hypothetical protein [candidate division Zixibacteria bacterium]
MTQPHDEHRAGELQLVSEVDRLSDQIKSLALNLALYLAKAKEASPSDRVNKLEPEFVRLINGTVRVVQEVANILNAARNPSTMVYDPPTGKIVSDQVEIKLRSILTLCSEIMAELRDVGNEKDERRY